MKQFAAVLFIVTMGSAMDPSEVYPRQLTLNEELGYVVYWKYSGLMPTDTITFEIIAKTKGWIGFGLSPQGGMPGADIIIAGVDDATNKGYLYVSAVRFERMPENTAHRI